MNIIGFYLGNAGFAGKIFFHKASITAKELYLCILIEGSSCHSFSG
jgi:hypothetical protein